MAPVKIKHVVSFTSQDPKNGVENLCVVGGDSRSWLCNPQDRSGVLRAELQLERASYFGYIDVGNCGSAFIQIDVGRSSWPLDQPYITLLPTATLMSPAESRQGTGLTGVRMFKKGDFLSEGAEDSWDRVRVTCTQPFNKRSQFGLSFLRIRSPLEESEEGSTQTGKESQGQTTPDKSASGVREWLSSPAVQRTFFGGTKGEGVVLSRTARMVLTASQAARRSLPLPLPSTSLSPSHTSSSGTQNTATSTPPTAKPDATTHIPNQGKPGAHTATPNKGKPVGNMGNIHPHTASMACLSTVRSSKENTSQRHQKRKPNSKSRQNQLNGTTCSKQGKPAVGKRPIATLQHTATAPHPQDTGDLETTCPICGVFFTAEYLPLHAASCQRFGDQEAPGGIVTPVPRPFPVSPASPEESMVPCPLCSFRFPLSHIQMHASTCGDPVDPHVIWVD
ncbi:LOW QUALITY PROTEIN: short transient receptor potential channel 2 [Salmo salar]|uniref:LOW QUALITY PROTEIN: short transient receptor potential channel 2 n=1 Tax=Salmo salar TaxID=8030 RepID=A0A1S3RJQ8_SALSA|nr:LOW QUALITY PROTEIN: short transient receptor potential channel 2 [Salmo salar]